MPARAVDGMPESPDRRRRFSAVARLDSLRSMSWTRVIDQQLQAAGGLATRVQLLRAVPATVIDGQLGRGQLQRVFPHVYARRGPAVSGVPLLRAALLHAGEGAALSHLTALHVWGVQPLSHPLHLTIDQRSKRAGAQGLVVHRRNDFRIEEHSTLVRGLRVSGLARSLVDGWPLVSAPRRRPLLLDLIRQRTVSTSDVRSSLAERPNVGEHRALAQAIDLAEAG